MELMERLAPRSAKGGSVANAPHHARGHGQQALLDLGTYPLSLVTWVLGRPERVVAVGQAQRASNVSDRATTWTRHEAVQRRRFVLSGGIPRC